MILICVVCLFCTVSFCPPHYAHWSITIICLSGTANTHFRFPIMPKPFAALNTFNYTILFHKTSTRPCTGLAAGLVNLPNHARNYGIYSGQYQSLLTNWKSFSSNILGNVVQRKRILNTIVFSYFHPIYNSSNLWTSLALLITARNQSSFQSLVSKCFNVQSISVLTT